MFHINLSLNRACPRRIAFRVGGAGAFRKAAEFVPLESACDPRTGMRANLSKDAQFCAFQANILNFQHNIIGS
jgi:hypothetical protein